MVRGDRVVFEDATGRQSIDLSTHATARGLVGNFGILLRGDLSELRRRLLIDIHGSDDSWTLEMRPRSREMRMLVERIEIEGEGDQLSRMTTFENNGDRTDLFFGKAIPLSELDPSERQGIFSIDSTDALP